MTILIFLEPNAWYLLCFILLFPVVEITGFNLVYGQQDKTVWMYVTSGDTPS